jgi:hypothetical protein
MYPLFKNESKKNWHLFGLIPNSWWMAPDWPSLGFTQQWSEYKNDCWKWTSLKIFHQETRGVIWRIEGGVTVSWVQPLWRTVWRFLKKLGQLFLNRTIPQCYQFQYWVGSLNDLGLTLYLSSNYSQMGRRPQESLSLSFSYRILFSHIGQNCSFNRFSSFSNES